MLALLRSSQTPTHSAWLPHSQSNSNASSEDKSSSGSTSTKSASQSEHRVKPGRYSTLHLGQNMRVVVSVHFKRCPGYWTLADEGAKRIGPAAGIPIFGLDALSSAGCGPPATVATRPGTV